MIASVVKTVLDELFVYSAIFYILSDTTSMTTFPSGHNLSIKYPLSSVSAVTELKVVHLTHGY